MSVSLHMLSAMKAGFSTTFGVPWRPGKLLRDSELSLHSAGGEIPSSFWPTAFWPDGSVKWTAHAALINPAEKDLRIVPEPSQKKCATLIVTDSADEISVKSDVLSCVIPKSGDLFIKNLARGGGGMNGRLLCRIRTSSVDGMVTTSRDELCAVEIASAELEQQSENRCCIKLCGVHKQADGEVPFLFTLRMYFYSGSDEVRLVHSLVINISDNRELSGLAVEFDVPMEGSPYNRHVAYAGDSGVYFEGSQGLLTHNGRGAGYYKEQQNLEFVDIEPVDDDSKWFLDNVHMAAVWENYRLSQLASNSWSLSKRTLPEAVRVHAVTGKRAAGMMYMGSRKMCAAFSIRDFWQKHPMTLEAANLAEDIAAARLWLWSDEATPMRFTPYDNRSHGLEFSYEGSSIMGHDPVGIANTNELTVKLFAESPTRQALWDFAQDSQKTALLVAEPEYYKDSCACGFWSLPNSEHPTAQALEGVVNSIEDFYVSQREQRSWYGFWNYGDIMHSYDPQRHVWRYDFGGCAWQNTEFVPNIWLWDQFLRSGREDTFYLARAMTRHTSEVDCYHTGKFAGLGTRHNVVHWGCSAKEARIMMAFLHRLFYFLTADERIGELMELTADADYAAFKKCPMALYYDKHEDISHMRSGPDWTAFASNWLAHDERFGDKKYTEKLLGGLADIEFDPLGLIAGPTFLYLPEDGHMTHFSDNNYFYHMIMVFGGAEVFFELMRLYPEDERLPEMLAEFGRAHALTEEELAEWTEGRVTKKTTLQIKVSSVKMLSWAARYYDDSALAAIAWNELIGFAKEIAGDDLSALKIQKVDELHSLCHTEELLGITTNLASQFSLAVFQAIELISEYIPDLN